VVFPQTKLLGTSFVADLPLSTKKVAKYIMPRRNDCWQRTFFISVVPGCCMPKKPLHPESYPLLVLGFQKKTKY
jgi:hypothetical protein